MSTLAQMTDEVLLNLTSFGMVQPKLAALTTAVDTDDTEFIVSSVNGITTGIGEIGTELVYVSDIDTATKTLTVIRGHLSTTAASHAVGDLYSSNPLFPKWMVQRAINDAIVNSFPTLFVVAESDLTADGLVVSYTMPDACERVREVKLQDLSGTQEWYSFSQWRFDYQLKKLSFHIDTFNTQSIKAIYEKRPIEITAAQDLTVSGLSSSARKYVVAQAAADLVVKMDNQRLGVNYAAADDMDPNRPMGSATKLAQTLLGIANLELMNERKRQTQQYPVTVNTAKGRF